VLPFCKNKKADRNGRRELLRGHSTRDVRLGERRRS
jgi:hypothetical protein